MTQRRAWTEYEDAEIRQRYPSEDNPATLANDLERTLASLRERARVLGVATRMKRRIISGKRCFTEQEDQAIRARYPTEGGPQLAKEMNRRPCDISNRAYYLGVSGPGHQICSTRASVDTTFFDTLNEQSAYILGYLFADGNVSPNCRVISVQCVESDIEIVAHIREAMKSTHSIRRLPGCDRRDSGFGVAKPSVRLQIASSILAQTLRDKYGVVPNKTKHGFAMPCLGDANTTRKLLPHFVRGNFDGDGHVCASHIESRPTISVGLLGPNQFLCELVAAISADVCLKHHPVPRFLDGTCSVCWSGVGDVHAIYRWMYPETEGYFCLKRKRLVLESYFAENSSAAIQVCGESHGGVKLTVADILAIRSQPYIPGLFETLARQYGVTASNIRRIYRRLTWKHLPADQESQSDTVTSG